MGEPQKLLYKQNLLGVECTASDSCECAFCQSCQFIINTLNHTLAICCENDLKEHYNFLAANIGALFEAVAERMNGNEYIQ